MKHLFLPLVLLAACRGAGDEPGADAAPNPDADEDEDGYTAAAGDCDDEDPEVNPGAAEVCDGVDNDCDGVSDADVDTLEPLLLPCPPACAAQVWCACGPLRRAVCSDDEPWV